MIIRWFDTLDSTNSEALRRLGEIPSGTVIAAREQTAGRGQRGNSWFAEAGQNLTFSIVLKFAEGEVPVAKAPWLNFLAANAVAGFLDAQDVPCSVKWPNDIYAGRRKICGMLLENTLAGSSLAATVIGIGINVNTEMSQLPEELRSRAVSLKEILGAETDIQRLITALTDELDLLCEALSRGETEDYIDEFRVCCFDLPEGERLVRL